MERHLKAHLYDISTAIDEIQSFFEQVPRRFDEYGKNLMLRRAIERNIGIIGEAVNKILKENPGIEISMPGQLLPPGTGLSTITLL